MKLPVPAFAWPLILGFLISLPILWLVDFPFLGLSSRLFWGIYFLAMLGGCVLIGVLGARKESLNDKNRPR